jgi:mannose-6-phosphate isomerase-like protein (cupin superfamily)
MFVTRISESPRNKRGRGQVSRLLLAPGQFGSRNLAITWVEAARGSQQPLHAHARSEQVYVIVRGRGEMIVGAERQKVDTGTMIFIPPRTPHAIRNVDDEPLVYVSASSPPFPADVAGRRWSPGESGVERS